LRNSLLGSIEHGSRGPALETSYRLTNKIAESNVEKRTIPCLAAEHAPAYRFVMLDG
jgi:hypothetical protein